MTLNIIDDSTPEVSREILIGNTNRYHTSLTEQEYAVTLKGTKVIFEGGHRATLEKAVKQFISMNHIPREVNEFSGVASDFVSTLSLDNKSYSYVWGDEFDGNALDLTKFSYGHAFGSGYKNGTYTEYKVSQNTKYSKISDGVFTMRAEMDESGNVKNSATICTKDGMWYKYGYAELRAKIPLKDGAWPAWWATDHCGTLDTFPFDFADREYLVEIDMFEAFGAENGQIKSNIHKWYTNSYAEKIIEKGMANSFLSPTDSSGNKVTHTETISNRNISNSYTISNKNEYHTFGFLWTPEKLQMSVDGEIYATYDLTNDSLVDSYSDNSGFINNPMHMIFDNWIYLDGCHGANADGDNATYSDFPIEFSIDYIRLYQTSGDTLYNIGLEN